MSATITSKTSSPLCWSVLLKTETMKVCFCFGDCLFACLTFKQTKRIKNCYPQFRGRRWHWQRLSAFRSGTHYKAYTTGPVLCISHRRSLSYQLILYFGVTAGVRGGHGPPRPLNPRHCAQSRNCGWSTSEWENRIWSCANSHDWLIDWLIAASGRLMWLSGWMFDIQGELCASDSLTQYCPTNVF